MKKITVIFLLMPFLTFCTPKREKLIEQSIYEQLTRYPKSTLQDIYKNFYQDKFGAEHAVINRKAAKDYLDYELQNMTDTDTVQTIERIGWRKNFVRVPLALVKNRKLSADTLLNAFLESAHGDFSKNIDGEWLQEWALILKIIEKKNLRIANFEQDKIKINSLLRKNPTMAVHHSDAFNSAYQPHYRIIKKEFFEKLKIKELIN
ncbi:MAG: hypothetical protein LBB53_04810 [Prevotellaceae bacterium]|jgi:hypothetical protein|nr:hypothetical protein [Prevotellaceae bacterium]